MSTFSPIIALPTLWNVADNMILLLMVIVGSIIACTGGASDISRKAGREGLASALGPRYTLHSKKVSFAGVPWKKQKRQWKAQPDHTLSRRLPQRQRSRLNTC